MFSQAVSSRRQFGQRERSGESTLSPSSGRRWMTTFRNEPITRPKRPQTAIRASRGSGSTTALIGWFAAAEVQGGEARAASPACSHDLSSIVARVEGGRRHGLQTQALEARRIPRLAVARSELEQHEDTHALRRELTRIGNASGAGL